MTAYNGTVAYGYDTKDQLLSEQKTNSTHPFNLSYGYDPAGNLTNNSTIGYNAANQVTTIAGVAQPLPDPSGNPTSIYGSGLPNFTANYDADNHLTSLTTSQGGGFTAGYYADGQRMWKQPNGGGSRTYFLSDGGSIPLCEFDGNGNITAFNTVGVNGLLSRSTPSGSAWNQTFYAFDWRGNTVNRLDGNGNLQTTSTYNAYNNRVSNLNDADPYDGFGGQYGYYKDTEAGPWFYLLGERYYQPDLGRFLTRDPIGQAGGINVYSYAGNNPINNVDPSGLDTFVFNGTILKRYSSSGPTAGQLIGSWP